MIAVEEEEPVWCSEVVEKEDHEALNGVCSTINRVAEEDNLPLLRRLVKNAVSVCKSS